MKDTHVAYLLGELDADGRAEFERAMASDPALRAEVDALRPVVTRLEELPSEAWEGVEPPPLASPPPRPQRPRGRRQIVLRPLAALACALVLLALGTGIGVLVSGGPNLGGADLALDPVGGRDPSAQGRVSLAGERVTLRVSGLTPTGDRQFYEVWLLGDDQRLVALGSFRVGADGTATMRLPLPVDPDRYRCFDISLQPDNGDPNHSGLSVLRGSTSS